MTMTQARRAVRLYSSDLVPLAVNKRNRRAYVASLKRLGDEWVYSPTRPAMRWGHGAAA